MKLKIVTLNLWSTPTTDQIFEKAVQFLFDQKADLIFLQEVNDGKSDKLPNKFKAVKILKEKFPGFYFDFARAFTDMRHNEGKVDNGQFLLSRFPIISSANIFFDVPYGKYDHDLMTDFSQFPANLQSVTIKVGEQKMLLLNLHGPVWYDGDMFTERRAKMAQKILDLIDQTTCPVILAGDSNATQGNKAIQLIKSKLKSVFENHLTTTFNVLRKDIVKYPGFAQSVVDIIFVSPNIKVISSLCPQVDISDHLPLIAEIALL